MAVSTRPKEALLRGLAEGIGSRRRSEQASGAWGLLGANSRRGRCVPGSASSARSV